MDRKERLQKIMDLINTKRKLRNVIVSPDELKSLLETMDDGTVVTVEINHQGGKDYAAK